MAYLKVTLLNDSQDKSVAEIVPTEFEGGVYPTVYSKNPKMKAHLEKLLQYTAYISSPGTNTNNFFADSVLELQPNTIYYINALPEILSWRGYNVKVVNETHKSVDYSDLFMEVDLQKSTNSGNIIYNKQGERVVKRVPDGYVAVHDDGRVVGGGKYLNANIDKEGASWTLVQNPHEKSTAEERGVAKQYMEAGLQEYHPGVEEGVYTSRESEDSDYYKADKPYKPSGKKLSDHFKIIESDKIEYQEVASSYPTSLEPGNVVYSPKTGQAFASELWPPKGIDYGNTDWYVFPASSLSNEEKEFYASLSGLSPALIQGVDGGIVQSEKDLDTSEGFKLKRDESQDRMGEMADTSNIVVNRVSEEKLEVREMLSEKWMESFDIAKTKLKSITDLTHKEISPELDELNLDNLRGANARFAFDLYPYQKAVVSAMTTEEQYEFFGGPKGWHGYFLNVKMGLGKTAMVAAANAIMRNKGLIKNGEQTTIVTAPNKNVFVWQSEVGKFLGEHAVVIDGDRQDRIDQWEEILDKARSGELPSFIVVGSSTFRYIRSDKDDQDSEQDAWELATDAKYMSLLAMGGKSGTKEVKGNHVGVFCVDESAQYVNPDSSRHTALKSIIESMYQGKALTWTLNGNISGNSATDTISDLSFVNKFVRDNYMAMVQEYTMTDRETFRESKLMGRRIWKDFARLKDFLYTFGSQIYSLDGRTVAGKDFGLIRTEDALAPLGPEWGSVYFEAERKLAAAASNKEMPRAFGLLSILINSGFGAVSPQRLVEYDIATNNIMRGMANVLSGQDLDDFGNQLKDYLDKTTDTSIAVGRFPKKGMSSQERDNIYKSTISSANRSALEQVVSSWGSPLVNDLLTQIRVELQQNAPANRNMKMGIAGFSKTAINNIANKLKDIYPSDNFLIQVVDGDTPAEEVQKIQDRHQKEEDKHVITLVTGAGLYGLSLPAERSWRFPTWNSSRGSQYEGRFHRKAEQKNISTVLVPEGITQYMRELEQRKEGMASAATNVLLDVDDSSDEIAITSRQMSRLLDKLQQYRPRVLGGD
jgi:hypothetical protein